MISEQRMQKISALFWAETSEDWTQEWRDELTEEEIVLVKGWDYDFTQISLRMRGAVSADSENIASYLERFEYRPDRKHEILKQYE